MPGLSRRPLKRVNLQIMKNGFNWLTVLVMFVVGILLIIWHARLDVLNWIIMAVGISLILPGLYDFVIALRSSGGSEKSQAIRQMSGSTMIVAVGAIALGVWMLISPSFFVGVMAYAFGAILVFLGIYHIAIVAYLSRPLSLPGFLYIIPGLLIIAGLVILLSSVRTIQSVVVLIMGISLVASSINSLLEYTSAKPR